MKKVYVVPDVKEVEDYMFRLDCSKPFDRHTNHFVRIKLSLRMRLTFSNYLICLHYHMMDMFLIIFNTETNEAWSLDIGGDNEWIKSNFMLLEFKDTYHSLKVVVGKGKYIYPQNDLFCVKVS